MKWCYRFLLPVFILLSVEAKSQVYTYHPFPSSNYTWEGFTNCGAMGNFWTDHWTFQNNGDVGSYHRLGSSILIREDSLKRVYLYSAVDTPSHELLLYDFSLNAGDTMHSSITYVVDYVDTLYYNTVWRRTLHTHALYGLGNDVWIEGIGSQQGPTGAWMYLRPSTGTGGPCSFSALCQAKQGGSLMYQRNLYGCPGYNSVDETSSDINVNLFPNPCATAFAIQLTTPPSAETYFQLYDALGRQVKREEINSTTTTIHRNSLPSGIYFWQLIERNKILERGKVVME